MDRLDRLVDKYPYKKLLFLSWQEAAIGQLLLFKGMIHLRTSP